MELAFTEMWKMWEEKVILEVDILQKFGYETNGGVI